MKDFTEDDIQRAGEYVATHKDELLRLFKDRWACLIMDDKGELKVDASYGGREEGRMDARARYGLGKFMLFHVLPPFGIEISRFPNYY